MNLTQSQSSKKHINFQVRQAILWLEEYYRPYYYNSTTRGAYFVIFTLPQVTNYFIKIKDFYENEDVKKKVAEIIRENIETQNIYYSMLVFKKPKEENITNKLMGDIIFVGKGRSKENAMPFLRGLWFDFDIHRPVSDEELSKIKQVVKEFEDLTGFKTSLIKSGGGVQVLIISDDLIEMSALLNKRDFDNLREQKGEEYTEDDVKQIAEENFKKMMDIISEGFKQRFSEVGLEVDIDSSVWDFARVMRLPFTFNQKYGEPVPVVRLSFEENSKGDILKFIDEIIESDVFNKEQAVIVKDYSEIDAQVELKGKLKGVAPQLINLIKEFDIYVEGTSRSAVTLYLAGIFKKYTDVTVEEALEFFETLHSTFQVSGSKAREKIAEVRATFRKNKEDIATLKWLLDVADGLAVYWGISKNDAVIKIKVFHIKVLKTLRIIDANKTTLTELAYRRFREGVDIQKLKNSILFKIDIIPTSKARFSELSDDDKKKLIDTLKLFEEVKEDLTTEELVTILYYLLKTYSIITIKDFKIVVKQAFNIKSEELNTILQEILKNSNKDRDTLEELNYILKSILMKRIDSIASDGDKIQLSELYKIEKLSIKLKKSIMDTIIQLSELAMKQMKSNVVETETYEAKYKIDDVNELLQKLELLLPYLAPTTAPIIANYIASLLKKTTILTKEEVVDIIMRLFEENEIAMYSKIKEIVEEVYKKDDSELNTITILTDNIEVFTEAGEKPYIVKRDLEKIHRLILDYITKREGKSIKDVNVDWIAKNIVKVILYEDGAEVIFLDRTKFIFTDSKITTTKTIKQDDKTIIVRDYSKLIKLILDELFKVKGINVEGDLSRITEIIKRKIIKTNTSFIKQDLYFKLIEILKMNITYLEDYYKETGKQPSQDEKYIRIYNSKAMGTVIAIPNRLFSKMLLNARQAHIITKEEENSIKKLRDDYSRVRYSLLGSDAREYSYIFSVDKIMNYTEVDIVEELREEVSKIVKQEKALEEEAGLEEELEEVI